MNELKKEIIPSKVKPLPPKILYEPIIKELTAAHSAVGELRGLLSTLPASDILIAPFRKREAVASSAIEGTRATLEEVFKYEAVENTDAKSKTDEGNHKVQDIIEIMNYEKAMRIALDELKKRKIGENLLKTTHHHLLNSVRGTDKNRGSFRKEQVRVGDYIPPVHTEIPELIKNWEIYLNNPNVENDPLIRIGVAHYQFEAIHPFMDGNGRIGRLIIPLFLYQEGLLQTPVLYISHHLEKHKVQYQDLLHKVDTDQDWTNWLRFFLIAVRAQAKITTDMANEILNLYKLLKDRVAEKIRSRYTLAILDEIFRQPIITANSIRAVIKAKSKVTTYNLIKRFISEGILQEIKSSKGETVYIFSDLMKIIRR